MAERLKVLQHNIFRKNVFARAVMVVVKEFVVCAVVVVLIIVWNVPSKFTNFSKFSPKYRVPILVRTNEAKFQDVNVTLVLILSILLMFNARKSAIMEESDVPLVLLKEWLHVRRVKEVVNLCITWN